MTRGNTSRPLTVDELRDALHGAAEHAAVVGAHLAPTAPVVVRVGRDLYVLHGVTSEFVQFDGGRWAVVLDTNHLPGAGRRT